MLASDTRMILTIMKAMQPWMLRDGDDNYPWKTPMRSDSYDDADFDGSEDEDDGFDF